jgi:hypothetical protein
MSLHWFITAAAAARGTFTESEAAQWLDRGRLEETGRRSYYRLFPEFAGSISSPNRSIQSIAFMRSLK